MKKPGKRLGFSQARVEFNRKSDVAASLIRAGRRLSGRGLGNRLVGLRKIIVAELSYF